MDDDSFPRETIPVPQIKLRRRRALLLAAGMLLLFLLLGMALLNPIPLLSDIFNIVGARAELPHAMGRWKTQGVSDYQINVKGYVPLVCLIDGVLTVHDGHLTQVLLRENTRIPEAPLHPTAPDQWDRPGCSYQDLSVGAMFERVDAILQEIGPFCAPLAIKFDETMGYITEYRFGRSSRGSMLEPRVSDCCTWIEFSDLTVISP
jgi:hypothetical protein